MRGNERVKGHVARSTKCVIIAHLVCAKDGARSFQSGPRAVPQLVVRVFRLAEQGHFVASRRAVLFCAAESPKVSVRGRARRDHETYQ